MIKKDIEYPIKKILTDIARTHEVPLSYFKGAHFLPETKRNQFPLLSDLSNHLAFPHGVGIEIEKDGMVAFEGSNKELSYANELSIAYFGRRVEKFSDVTKNVTREHGLVYSHGRRIHLTLNENGNGGISLEDVKAEEARSELGADSFGGSYDEKPKGKYGFRQGVGSASALPGVKEFLNTIIG